MTTATTTSLGVIRLAGDLAGNNNGLAPELTPTGVAAGVHTLPVLTVNTKGQVTVATSASPAVVTALIPDATSTTKGIGSFPSAGGLVISAGAVSAPDASGAVKGIARFGTEFTVTAGAVALNTTNIVATNSALGLVQSGTNIINTAGTLSVADATSLVKGVARFNAADFTVTDGAVSLNSISFPVATNSTLGTVITGANITNTAGTISIETASSAVRGIARFSATDFILTTGNVALNYATIAPALSSFFPDASSSVKGRASFGADFTVTAGNVVLNYGVVGPAAAASIPDASSSVKGRASFGSDFTVTAGNVAINYTVLGPAIASALPDATSSVKGKASFGADFTVTAGNVAINYTNLIAALPAATNSALGLVRSGTNITNTAGTLSLPNASTTVKGVASFNSADFSVSAGAVSLVGGAGAFTTVQNLWTRAQSYQIHTLSFAASVTPDFAQSNVYSLTATGNFTLNNPTNVVAGTTYILMIRQDATGGRLITWGGDFKFGSGAVTTLSTGANRIDIVSVVALTSSLLLTTTQLGFV